MQPHSCEDATKAFLGGKSHLARKAARPNDGGAWGKVWDRCGANVRCGHIAGVLGGNVGAIGSEELG